MVVLQNKGSGSVVGFSCSALKLCPLAFRGMILCQVAMVAVLTGHLIGKMLPFGHKLHFIFYTLASVNFLLHNKLSQKLVS